MLRAWRSNEAGYLVSICDDDEVAFRTPIPKPFPVEYAQRLIDGRDGYLDLAIVDEHDVPVGLATVNLTTHSVSYVVSPAARGRGIATGALRHLCRMLRAELGFEQIVLEIEPGNRASEVVAKRCGFALTDNPLEEVEDKGRAYTLATWALDL